MKAIILRNLKVPIGKNSDERVQEVAASLLRRERIPAVRLSIVKKSIDARKKDAIHFVYSIRADVERLPDEKKLVYLDATVCKDEMPSLAFGECPLEENPVVVGLGPCGLFCALLLAENGYKPTIIERGGDVWERQKAVARFYREGILDPSCNIQFGAGGAGTFSDGKLMTRINDPLCSYVLDRFCEFGAPDEIRIAAKPHIGTDLLLGIVDRMITRIRELGGKILYHTTVTGFSVDKKGKVKSAITNEGEIPCGVLVLAPGHSSRDTYQYLLKNQYSILPKSFSVGVRIEHLQESINRALYGDWADQLPPAEYNLAEHIGQRGVYSFCMCPGGEVVAAASEFCGVVTNGMSRHARNGKNANSALAVSVFPEDYGNQPELAIDFIRKIEQRAYQMGGKNYNAPLQTVGDFLSEKSGTAPTGILSTYMGGDHYQLCDLRDLFPSFVTDTLSEGIKRFGKKLAGFDSSEALLTGPETRTSAPLRILRGEDGTAPGHTNLYPCGEGAGYAGGITSAAVDGIRTAGQIMKKYRKVDSSF